MTVVAVNEVAKQPSDERSAGGSGEGEPFLSGSPDRPFLLYRQRHVFFSAGRKENVGLELWVLTVATLMLVKAEETYASSTRNRYLLYARIFSVGACGAVLSIDGKYPKVAGTIAMRPRPSTLFRYSGGPDPLGAQPNPRRGEGRVSIRYPSILHFRTRFDALPYCIFP